MSLLIFIALIAGLGSVWQGSASAPTAIAGEKVPGDVDCDDDVDSVDGLKVLRHTAGLPNQQPGGCPSIGSAPARVGSQGAVQGPGSMTAMSVDMALFGNSPTSVLSIQPCAQLNANGRQDAEETGVDTLTFDVTAQGIPAEASMIVFAFTLIYDSQWFTVQSEDQDFMLAALPSSDLFSGSDLQPDSDGQFFASATDIGDIGSRESGSGVLSRITISAMPETPTGQYNLALTDNLHGTPGDVGKSETHTYIPLATNNGVISINEPCAVKAMNGDVDCDGDVDSVDALRILREVAALPNELPVGCPPIS